CPRSPDLPVCVPRTTSTAAVQHQSRSWDGRIGGRGESMGNARVLSGDGPAPQPLVRAGGRPHGLRGSLGAALPLLILDAGAICLAWFLVAFLVEGRVLSLGSRIGSPMLVLAVALFVLIGNHARGLYAEARGDRALELVGCARSCFFAAIAVVLAGEALGVALEPMYAAGAAGVCLVLLI